MAGRRRHRQNRMESDSSIAAGPAQAPSVAARSVRLGPNTCNRANIHPRLPPKAALSHREKPPIERPCETESSVAGERTGARNDRLLPECVRENRCSGCRGLDIELQIPRQCGGGIEFTQLADDVGVEDGKIVMVPLG